MGRKTVIVADPGIDVAFACAVALHDPDLEVLGLAATAGNVGPDQATRNVQTVVEMVDPVRWPRLGAALGVEYDVNGKHLNGPDGLGGCDFPCATLHHTHSSDKLIIDQVRQYPKEVALLVLGPATVLARALDREPDLTNLVSRIILVGGAWSVPGDATAVAEFHFYCDPPAARQVLRCGAPITLVPLDACRKLVFSPGDVRHLPAPESRSSQFLERILPCALAPTAGLYGIEGVYLDALLGVVALVRPAALTARPIHADVETRGELTRGMSVFDTRWSGADRPNIDLVTDVDVQMVREYIAQTLGRAGGEA